MWFVLALITAVCWAGGYVLTEKVLHSGVHPTIAMLFGFICVPVYFGWALIGGHFKSSLDTFGQNKILWLYAGCATLLFLIGNACITYSVQMKNATYANLIEITYPVFTVLFSYVLFKSFHLNAWSMAGGMLILLGAALVVWKG